MGTIPIRFVCVCVCAFLQCQELKVLQDTTHRELWIADLDAFMEELDVSQC